MSFDARSVLIPLPINIAPVGPPEGLQRLATPWRPAASVPLGGREVGCKVGLWRAYGS